jgi:hypothetical protein
MAAVSIFHYAVCGNRVPTKRSLQMSKNGVRIFFDVNMAVLNTFHYAVCGNRVPTKR